MMGDDCIGSGDGESVYYSGREERVGGQRIGAVGFGLNRDQQEAIADLWAWHERSRDSELIIGGSLTPERKELLNQIYGPQMNE